MSAIHAVPGWDEPGTAQNQRVRIPAQRAGNAYETAVLQTEGDTR